jgi:hypothetical protein
MKNMYPINAEINILNTTKDKDGHRVLIFTPLNEKQHNKFCEQLTLYNTYPRSSPKKLDMNNQLLKLHNFSFTDIVAIGDTKMETRQANNYIENHPININSLSKRNYKCFVNHGWEEGCNAMNLPYHEDGGSSWNCLMEKLKQPKFGIIFSIPFSMLFKFKINE